MARPGLADKLALLEEWFRRENTRPLIGFSLGEDYPLHRYRDGIRRLPDGIVRPEDVHVGDYLDDETRLGALHEAAGGDLPWCPAPFWGIPWVEAALGCGVIADKRGGATRATPPPDFAASPVVPEFDPANPWVRKLLEFIPALRERFGAGYPVGVSLMRGISDLLSALYGGEAFILRMIDRPDEVRRVIDDLTRFWIAYGRCVLDHIPAFRGGTGAFFYSMWCPGRTIWTQEDAAALLSPALYAEFILPAVERVIAAFEHVAIHLHPSMFIPVDCLVQTDIAVIELHLDVGGKRAWELESVYRRILARKPLLIWGDVTEADLDFLLQQLPARGLAINCCVPSPDAAHGILARTGAGSGPAPRIAPE